mgnify:CR=1 FL=1
MIILKKILKLFKRADDLREMIEDRIADALEKASNSEILDKGEEILLKAAIEAIEAYASGKTGQKIDVPANAKNSIIAGIISGHNKLQKVIAKQLRK